MITLSINAQEQKVEIVPDSLFFKYKKPKKNDELVLSCSTPGVIVQCVSSDYYLPFKLYDFSSKKENWHNTQDIYNAIQAKVPGISITANNNLNQAPNIRMRGDNNTIVIVDGIRYDTSILNTLNPADIESVTVVPGVAASNYLRNGFRN